MWGFLLLQRLGTAAKADRASAGKSATEQFSAGVGVARLRRPACRGRIWFAGNRQNRFRELDFSEPDLAARTRADSNLNPPFLRAFCAPISFVLAGPCPSLHMMLVVCQTR